MKMKNNDTELKSLLQEWRVTSALPPRFTEQVWKGIERAEVPSVSFVDAVRAWFAMAFARPAFAVAYVSALLVMGLTLGFVQANNKSARWERQLEARYVQSIDPYQKGQR
jgi:hypothetical protein